MALGAAGLQTSIWNNNLLSVLLLVLYPMLLTAIVWSCAFAVFAAGTTGNTDVAARLAGDFLASWGALIFVAVAVWFLISWLWNAALVRRLSGGHPVTRAEEPELYNLLENLCITAGVTPTPRLEIIETDALNAFASGVDRRSYTVTVTRGLLKTLRKDELEAVLGHELTHILNRDVRLLMVCVIFTGLVGFLAQMGWHGIRAMMHASSSSRRDNKGGNGKLLIILVIVTVILWIGYFATMWTRFALSRRREFMADAGSIALTKNPEAMMRALMRISGLDRIPDAPDDIALMCIENRHRFFGLFLTHPPIKTRLDAISSLTHTPIPDLNGASAPVNPWG